MIGIQAILDVGQDLPPPKIWILFSKPLPIDPQTKRATTRRLSVGSWLYARKTVLPVTLSAMMEGESYIIPVVLKLIVIEGAAPSEALVVAAVVCS